MRAFSVILATDMEGGIGKDGGIPWDAPGCLERFKELTSDTGDKVFNVLAVGRVTYEGLPKKFNRGHKRVMSIIGSGEHHYASLEELMSTKQAWFQQAHHVWVIGGARVYEEALKSPRCTEVYWTEIPGTYACDRFAPLETLEAMATHGSGWRNEVTARPWGLERHMWKVDGDEG